MRKSRFFLFCSLSLLALVFVVSGPTLTPSYQECQNEHSQRPASENNNGAGNSSVSIAKFRISIGNYLDCWGNTARENGEAITALATVFLTAITYMLVMLGREQSKTTRAQLRAYVMVAAVTHTDLTPDTIPITKVRIKNFGQTPAHDIRVTCGMGFAPYPFREKEWPAKTTKPGAQFGRSLGPQDDMTLPISLESALSEEKIAAVHEGRWALWINGRIFYKDTFEEPHETEFGMFTGKDTNPGFWAGIDTLNRCS